MFLIYLIYVHIAKIEKNIYKYVHCILMYMLYSENTRYISGYNTTQANANRTNSINTLINVCSPNKGLLNKEITCKNGHIYCNSCKETKYRHVTRDVTFRDILKIPKLEDKYHPLKYIQATSVDLKEITNHTNVNGYSSQYNKIVSILHDNIIGGKSLTFESNQPKLDKLMSFTKSDGMVSKVGSLSSSTTRLAKDVRNSTSFRFSEDLTNKLSDAILPELLPHMRKEFNLVGDRLLDLLPCNHGDIILYENDGKFDLHRDKTPLNKPCQDAEMFSYILCLDSNLNDRFFADEGNTLIYNLPWRRGTINTDNRILNRRLTLPTSPVQIKMSPHLYPETVTPSGFLVFNSRKKHASVGINDELTHDGKVKFKFILKLDFWVICDSSRGWGLSYFPILDYYTDSDNINEKCKCKLCSPNHHTTLQLMNIVYPQLNDDVLIYILSFIDTDTIHNKFSNLLKKSRISNKKSTYVQHSNFYEWHSFFDMNERYNDLDDDFDDCND
jgi:hypothetical protein